MTKKYFIELAEFNSWANDITHGWLEKISEEQWTKPIVSSFDSLEKTALHVTGAEKVWVERLQQMESPVWLPNVFKGSKSELLSIWKEASKNLKSFIEDFDEKKLETELVYTRLNGQTYSTPYYQVIAHVVNHSSYHRGQFVTMLRQAGFTEVTSTDMSRYFTENKK